MQSPSPQDLTRSESVGISRHDQHNLEIKFSLNTSPIKERVGVDLFLFLPGNLNLAHIPRAELREDFRCRMRLGTQQSVGRQASRVRILLAQTQHAVEAFASDSSSQTLEEIFQKTRELGAILGELLKFEARRLKAELLAATSRSHLAPHREKILKEICVSLTQLNRLVNQAEQLCACEEGKGIPVLELLHQYVHSLFSDFIVRLGNEQAAIPTPESEDQALVWRELAELIRDMRLSEAKFQSGLSAVTAENQDAAQEIRLLRQSQIKKFFQSQMFMEVQRTETLRRFSEPAATGAAAFAAIGAAAFEYMSRPGLHGVGLQGAMVLGTGVALYVLRDRLKDKFRSVFTSKLSTVLPEAEQSLTADGYAIGKVREWFSRRKTQDLDAQILAVRRRGDLTEAEKHLPEEVLQFGQQFDLEPCITSYGDFQRTIQQVLRVNIERFLKHLDDAYKTIALLDEQGEFRQVRSHRVYHFHVAVRMNRQVLLPRWRRWLGAQSQAVQVMDQIYRVVVDKNGIDRVEAV